MSFDIPTDALDENVLRIGQVIGLINNDNSLDTSWFSNAGDELKNAFDSERHVALLGLLENLLGSADAQTVGMPNASAEAYWYPIRYEDGGVQKETGVYLTVLHETDALIFGVGAKWEDEPGGTSLELKAWAHHPLLRVSDSGVDFVMGQSTYPVDLAFEVNDTSTTPTFGTEDLNFDGVRLGAHIFFDQEPDFSFVFLNLKLPDGNPPSDRSLLDLSNIGADEWINMLVALLTAQLETITGDAQVAAVARHLMPLFGFSDDVPSIRWENIASGGDIFMDWLREIVANTSHVEAWLTHLGKLLSANEILPITGTGSRTDPYRAAINLSSDVHLDVTLAVVANTDGTKSVYPAISVRGSTALGSGVLLSIEGVTELLGITINNTANPIIEGLTAFSVRMRLHRANGTALATKTFTNVDPIPLNELGTFAVGELRAGLQLNAAHQPFPMLELVNVTCARGSYPVLDLSSGDKLLDVVEEVAGDVASSVVVSLVDELLDQIGGTTGNHPGRHVAALLGLIEPPSYAGNPTPYPVDLVTANLPQFLGNPMQAIGCYHSACLETMVDSAAVWRFMLEELSAILRHTSIASLNITGSGTENVPWQVILFDESNNRGTLQAWTMGDSGRNQLRLSFLFEPEAAALSTDITLTAFLRMGLLHLDLPDMASCPAPIHADWLPSVALGGRIDGTGTISTGELAGLTVEVDSVSLSADWEQAGTFDWSAEVTGLTVTVSGGTPINLPSLSFNPSALPTLNDVGDFFRLLLGRWLMESAGPAGFGLSGLLGLLPDMPSLTLPSIPAWATSAYSLPSDWPTLDIPDYGAFFANPFPTIRLHLGRLLSNPDWALPALRWLAGTIHGALPDFSIPDLNLPTIPSIAEFPIRGSGTYEDPWAIELAVESAFPFEILLWLDPQGPAAGSLVNAALSWLPASLQDLSTLDPATLTETQLIQILRVLSQVDTTLHDALGAVVDSDLIAAFGQLNSFLLNSDGFVPIAVQRPSAATTTWDAPQNPSALPVAHHIAQLANTDILNAIEGRINSLSSTAPVLLLAAPWSEREDWEDLLSRFGQSLSSTPHVDFQQAGVDPAFVSVNSLTGATRFYTAQLNPFNLDPTASSDELPLNAPSTQSSIAAQVSRVVDRIRTLHGGTERVIIVAHSVSGLAARAAAVNDGDASRIMGVITIGTPHLSINPPWAIAAFKMDDLINLLRNITSGTLPDTAYTAALTMLYETMTNAGNLLRFPLHMMNPAGLALDLSSGVDGLMLATRLASGVSLRGVVLDWIQERMTALSSAFDARQPVTHLGFGLRRIGITVDTTGQDVQAVADVRVDIARAPITTGTVDTSAYVTLPRLHLLTSITRAGGWLVGDAAADVRLRWAQLGCSIAPDDVEPIVRLYDTHIDDVLLPRAVLTRLSNGSFNAPATMTSLINALLETLTQETVIPSQQADELATLLSYLDITLEESLGYGINPDGWTALLDNPQSYLRNKLNQILASTDAAAFYEQVMQTFGASLGDLHRLLVAQVDDTPTATAVREVLAALNLAENASKNYALKIQAILDLLKFDATALDSRLNALLAQATTRSQLLQRLRNLLNLNDASNPVVEETIFNLLRVRITSTGQVTITLLNPFAVADELAIGFRLHVDLQAATIDIAVDVRYARIGAGLVVGFERDAEEDFHFKVAVDWSENGLPAPYEPLRLVPPAPDLENRLREIVPRFVLSSVATLLLESAVMRVIPSAVDFFAYLGLAYQATTESLPKLRGLDGLFMHPKEWLLSEGALGTTDGNLSPAQLVDLLNDFGAMAGISSSGVINLPYGAKATLSSSGQNAVIEVEVDPALTVADGTTIAPLFRLSLSPTLQVTVGAAILATIALPAEAGWDALHINAAFSDENLSFNLSDGSGIILQLYPFAGFDPALLGNIATEAAFRLLPLLLQATTEAMGDIGGNVQTVANNLIAVKNALGLNTLEDFDALLADPLSWLEAKFVNSTTATATVNALANLVSGGVSVPGLSFAGGMVTYMINPPSIGTLLISVGFTGGNIVVSLGVTDFATGPIVHTLTAQVSIPVSLGTPTFGFDLLTAVAPDIIAPAGVSIEPALHFVQTGTATPFVIYPLGQSADTPDFELQILPTLNFTCGSGSIEDCLFSLTKTILVPIIGEILIDTSDVTDWLNTPLFGTGTAEPGDVLVQVGLLEKVGDNYNLVDLDTLPFANGLTFLSRLLGAALNALSGTVLLSFPTEIGGGISIENSGNLYGLRVNLPHITVSEDPEIVLLLGSVDTDTGEKAWISGASTDPAHAALKPGVTLWLVEVTGAGAGMIFSFEPALSIVNIGINVSGKADQPLFNVDGFKMDGFEARLLFDITDLTGSVSVDFGAVGEIHQLGIPLGSFAGDNPVAQNLLSGGNGSGGDSAAVNPGFNISVAYINKLYINFDGTSEIWIPIQSGFGPVHIQQIGLSWAESNQTIKLLVDGNVSLAGLTVEFDDLFLAYSILLDEFSFGLRGLGVSYVSDSVKIAGALLETPGGGYAGIVLVEVSGRTFSALGAYQQLASGDPSMFVFVVVSIPLGGPPYFFVLGLAGGFGYNRNLIAPPIEGVDEFPFVAVATGSSAISQPMTMLQALGQSVPPTVGSYWLAAGLRFSSFALVNSFALLYVLLNEGFEIGLLGVATMELPPAVPLVSIEMALKVRFSTVDGVFSVEAQLTDNSWLLDTSCRLTGGFAFFLWFAGPHQGDFVITLGGYHPRFAKPDHFPLVPRLGFNWRVSSNIVIKGEAYFALTNSAVMAGGLLEASYQSGALKAWFKVWADFLVQWKPFFYDIEIGISIGVSYRLHIDLLFGSITKTFKVELGARLRIWGPEFSGEAEITWWVISFTVRFGANASQQAPLVDWGTFREDFLPETIYYAEIETGLLEEEDPPHWRLKPEFVIKTETAFAANAIQVGDNLDTASLLAAAVILAVLFGIDIGDTGYQTEDLDIRPMGESDMLSIHMVDIRRVGGSSVIVNAVPNLSEDAVFDESRYIDEAGTPYKLMTEITYLTDQDEKIRFQIVRDFLPGALWDTDIEGADLKKVTVPGIVGLRVIVGVDEQKLRDHHATGQIDVKQKDLGPVIHPLPFHREIPNRFVVSEVANMANLLTQLEGVSMTAKNLLNTAQYILASDVWGARRETVIQALQAQGAVVELPTAEIATTYTMSRRSAPPQIVSLYEGMAADVDENAELEDFVPITRPPITLATRSPKLIAIMRQRPEPTRSGVPSRRTTVFQVDNQRNLNRVAVTTLREATVSGAKLQRITHPNAARPTTLPMSGHVFLHSLNATPAQSQQFNQLQERAILQSDAANLNRLRLVNSFHRAADNQLPGVLLHAGAAQVWDIPSLNAIGRLPEIAFTGNQALRITALDRSGNLLSDAELFGSGRYELPLLTARVIVTGFGVPVDKNENLVPAMGAISLNEATHPIAIVGWQHALQMLQVGQRTVLGRGAVVKTGDTLYSSRKRQRMEQALTTGAAMMQNQEILETWLPASVNTVGVLIEHKGSTTEESAQSLNLGVTDAVLTTKPTMVMGGSLALFLYGVRDVKNLRGAIRIAASLQSGWTIRGMVGMVGSVAYWTGALATQSLDALVENGPLTPYGETRLAFLIPPRDNPNGNNGID